MQIAAISRSASNGMKVLFLTKYPPIEGGVSAQNYWLARALGEKDVQISVVTNALLVEDAYRENINWLDGEVSSKFQPKNVFLYSLKNQTPTHIPYSPAYLSRLVNLGLKAIAERGADAVYAHYLEPYASAGFILKKITGLPLVIKHAGSDIWRLLRSEDFKYFLGWVIKSADALLTSESLSPMFKELGVPQKKIKYIRRAVNPAQFASKGARFDFSKAGFAIPPNVPLLTYIGKANLNKGLFELIEALSGMSSDFRFLFVSNGPKFEELKARINSHSNIKDKFVYLGFVPPWEIPNILRATDFLFQLENDFPVPIHGPVQPSEAIACGTPVILSEEIFSKLRPHFPSTSGKFIVVKDPRDPQALREVLKKSLNAIEAAKSDAGEIREEFLSRNHWDQYVSDYIELFDSVAGRRFNIF